MKPYKIFTTTLIASVLLVVMLLTTCSMPKRSGEIGQSNEKVIYKKDYRNDWPFTVDEGVLKCISNSVVFVTNGKTYAVNGTAQNVAKKRGYENVENIWAEGTDIGQVIADGLKLCDDHRSKLGEY